MNSETFPQNKNKKEIKNTQIQRTLFPEHSLRLVPANCTKICNIPFFHVSSV